MTQDLDTPDNLPVLSLSHWSESSVAVLAALDPGELSPEQQLICFSFLHALDKAVKKPLKTFKAVLMEEVKSAGKLDLKGSYNLGILDGKATATARKSVKVDTQKLFDLLESKGIETEDVGEATVTIDRGLFKDLMSRGFVEPEDIVRSNFSPREEDVENLIAREKITAQEYADCCEVETTYAFKHKSPSVVKEMLSGRRSQEGSSIQK